MHISTQSLLTGLTPNVSGVNTSLPTTTLFGQAVANTTMTSALAWLSGRMDLGVRTRVAFLNAHCVNLAAKDPVYHDALRGADAVLPDGSGVALAAWMHGTPLSDNLNGTDLVPLLCARLVETGRSVFLLGGRPGIAAAAAAALVELFPGLQIAGEHHGYFEPSDEDRLVSEINHSGAEVVLVAFGVPAQETWLQRVAPRLNATLTLGVGGLFDFLSGRIPRAPTALRRLGLEWTYRLYQEPKRMWRRYLVGNLAFMAWAVVAVTPKPSMVLRSFDLALKRIIDIVGASIGLLVGAPIFLAVAASIRMTSPGPAFLRQTRVGKHGKAFNLYKFRSMYIDADARRAELERDNQHGVDGITFKLRRDPRVTPVGRLLRRSSIDEMPQLWNVLTGAMSLVGPRPPLPAEVARYLPDQRRRLESKPGLTCLWQISGRADLPFEKQVALDIEYLAHRNVWVDLIILLRTVPAVLTARGADLIRREPERTARADGENGGRQSMNQTLGNAAAADRHGRHVLLVENGPTFVLLARSLLERWGFTVEVADRADAALQALSDRLFDIAVVGSTSPGAVAVAEACVTAEIPILALASGGRTLEGATAQVTNPINAALMHEAVLQCLAGTYDEITAKAGIDVDVIAALWGDPHDPGFLRVAAVFITELEDFLRRAPTLFAGGDRTAVEREAHSIKGAASNVGAGELSVTAMKLEDAVLTADTRQIRALLSEVEAAADPVIAGLLSLIHTGMDPSRA